KTNVPETRAVEDGSQRGTDALGGLRRGGCFEVRVGARLSYEQQRGHKAHDGDDDSQVERLRPQGAVGGDVARDPRHHAHGEVAGELVQSEGEAAALRSD